MSTHYENVDITHPQFSAVVQPARAFVGESFVDPEYDYFHEENPQGFSSDVVSLVLNYDEVVTITGPRHRLHEMLLKAANDVLDTDPMGDPAPEYDYDILYPADPQ